MEIKIILLDNFKVPFLHVCFEIIPNSCKPVLQPNYIFVKTVHLNAHAAYDFPHPESVPYIQEQCENQYCAVVAVLVFYGPSTQLGRNQLSYPYCSWASLLGSLQVLSAHSFANNWQLPFLNQRKGENGQKNYFTTNLHQRILPDVRIEPATIHIPGRQASDRAIAPRQFCAVFNKLLI